MATATCGAQIKNRKRAKDCMQVMGLNETIDQ